MGIRYTLEHQKRLCEDWLKSGQSKRDFCKSKNISKSALYKWLDKYVEKLPTKANVDFLPLSLETERSGGGLEILFSNGALLRGDSNLVKELVQELLR